MKRPNHVWAQAGMLVSIACLLMLIPLWKPGFIVTDDGDWMVIRLSAFYQTLRDGQFPTRFLGRLNHSFGYPVSNFLYPGFLYIGSGLHLLGFNFVDSVKVIISLGIFGTSWFIFLWLMSFVPVWAAVIGSISFIFSPYVLFDIYRRGSVGEVLAFFPFSGLLYAIETKKRWLIPFLVGLLLISHNSLALIFLPIVISYSVVRKRMYYLLPIALGIGIASFYWMPAFGELRYVIFNRLTISDPYKYFATGDMSYLLGYAVCVSIIFLLFVRKSIKMTILFFPIITTIFLFGSLPISGFLWRIPTVVTLFQFPYRFLSVTSIIGTYCIAISLVGATGIRRMLLIGLYGVLLLFPAMRILSEISYSYHQEGYYTTNEATTTVSGEYMPFWVSEIPTARFHKRLEIIEGEGSLVETKISTQRLEATVVARTNSIIQANTMFYPGWGVRVNGHPETIQYQNKYGLMRFVVPIGEHVIQVEFHETPFRLVADLVSILSLVGSGIYIYWLNRRIVAKRRR